MQQIFMNNAAKQKKKGKLLNEKDLEAAVTLILNSHFITFKKKF